MKKGVVIIVLFTCLFVPLTRAQETDGFVIFYYDNGNKSSEGTMRQGVPDGFWKTYYETGILKSEGLRKEFQLDSVWVFYRTDGSLESKISYSKGLKEGEESLFTSEGKLTETQIYVRGKKHGVARYFYDSGELYREVPFLEGKEEGKGYEYGKDGRIITVLTYRDGFIRSIEKQNRFNQEGQKTGYWTEYYESGILKEEGTWNVGLRDGIFKFYTRKGDLDRIEKYSNGVVISDAEESVILDIRREYYPDGKLKMVGSYREGSREGVFREYDENGKIVNSHIYQGNAKIGEGIVDAEGLYEGEWKLYYASGELKAEGKFVAGKKEGPWIYYFKNGSIEQKGEYKEGNPAGKWVWYYSGGELLKEEYYRKGKEDGLSVEYTREGKIINKGEFIDGLKTGDWQLTVGDHTEKGAYIDGERTGKWVHTYDNGKPSFEGEFANGIPLGKHRYYYRNGVTKEEGKYKAGLKEGDWLYYDEEFNLLMTIKFRNGTEYKIDGVKLPQSSEASSVNTYENN